MHPGPNFSLEIIWNHLCEIFEEKSFGFNILKYVAYYNHSINYNKHKCMS